MKFYQRLLVAALFTFAAATAQAASMKLALNPTENLTADKPTHITLTLTKNDGSPVTMAMLKEVHTQKLHLLVVDPSLTDYHHLHPTPGAKPGEYEVEFTPKKSGMYRVWADVTAAATGKQEYLQADIGTMPQLPPTVDKAQSLSSDAGGYHFNLQLDGDVLVGQMVMAKLTVTRDGQPFNQLEPVMGAYAHVVGFGEDYSSIMHIHPMGDEPTKTTDLGGPTLEFHLEPKKVGFVKLFAQIRVGGHDIFAPLGIIVRPVPGMVSHDKPAEEHHH